jgi:tRNA A-37 threonylcarbamoyl transferase component Bud32
MRGAVPPAISIPGHELLRCIGRGSYGEVWLAAGAFSGYRAVKIVRRKTFEHERPFERELSGIRRFELISRSQRGMIEVLDFGVNTQQGYFYYVMELGDDQVSGRRIVPESYSPKTLAKEISLHGKLPFQYCLELGLTLSLALVALHKRGLVHRDVKPSNIIFVSGTPRLADIGLLAGVDEAHSYVGTEGFIPPEGPGAPQADIYSLGKVLYEASTGKDRHEFPELPTGFDRFPDHDLFLELNEVILRACRTDLARRYQTAWDMYVDLLMLENGQSLKCLYSPGRRKACLKWVGAALLLSIGARAVALHQAHPARSQIALHESTPGEPARPADAARSPFVKMHLNRNGQFVLSVRATATPANETNYLAQIWDTATSAAAFPAMKFSQAFSGVSLSDDGGRLVTFTGNLARCWDVFTGVALCPPLIHTSTVSMAFFTPDGARVVTASGNLVHVRDTVSGEAVFPALEHPVPVVHAEFDPGGSRLVTCCFNEETAQCRAQVWDAATGRPRGAPLRQKDRILSASFSPDGRRMVTAGDDCVARVWDVDTGQPLSPPLLHAQPVRAARFSPDGKWIVTASRDSTARVWNAETGDPLTPPLRHVTQLSDARFLPDGRRIFTADSAGRCWIWQLPIDPKPVEDLRNLGH